MPAPRTRHRWPPKRCPSLGDKFIVAGSTHFSIDFITSDLRLGHHWTGGLVPARRKSREEDSRAQESHEGVEKKNQNIFYAGNSTATSRRSSNWLFVKHLVCYFKNIVKLGPTLSNFYEVELLKLKVCLANNFNVELNFIKLSSPKHILKCYLWPGPSLTTLLM
jgi:hypothetical protein